MLIKLYFSKMLLLDLKYDDNDFPVDTYTAIARSILCWSLELILKKES